ncbi:hypothetical protein M8818_003978 [Zalaria obscura]|uniref:Uncharacterized protein n=1 Tax=Zalaria obscura TaxID=2024903 RepID=A0ACC3SD87_9PEZI
MDQRSIMPGHLTASMARQLFICRFAGLAGMFLLAAPYRVPREVSASMHALKVTQTPRAGSCRESDSFFRVAQDPVRRSQGRISAAELWTRLPHVSFVSKGARLFPTFMRPSNQRVVLTVCVPVHQQAASLSPVAEDRLQHVPTVQG